MNKIEKNLSASGAYGSKRYTCMNWMKILPCIVLVIILSSPAIAQKKIHSVYFEGSDHELNVYRIYGEAKGKTILLIGGIQGDEPGGFISADHYADVSLAKGNLIVVPRANFHSIVLNRRKINEDMNRKFAEDQKINYETKIVGILKKLIKESDCLLNLHDGSGFYSEHWEDENRNPKRYGQSIIADCEVFTNAKTGEVVNLGEMGRTVAKKINKNIQNPQHYFHFNNHKTDSDSSLHKEQRKSATYYAVKTCGVPAFGIETSKTLPLEMKVRHHNLAINAFMEVFGVIPETPGLNIDPPVLKYLVISVNDSLPVVIKKQQTLYINPGDEIAVSHIEANYERGLSADILGYGTINDIRKKIAIKKPTRIVVRKDYYPCGSVYVALAENNQEITAAKVIEASPNGFISSLLLFKIKCNGEEKLYSNNGHLKLVKGNKFKIIDVITGMVDPSELVVNLKGFVGNPKNNTGEDRGYEVHTGKDLWERYSKHGAGKQYNIIVSHNGRELGKLFVDLIKPELKYVVMGVGETKNCLEPGDTLLVKDTTLLKLIDINTNVHDNSSLKAFLVPPSDNSEPFIIKDKEPINDIICADGADAPCTYRIDVQLFEKMIGSVYIKLHSGDAS